MSRKIILRNLVRYFRQEGYVADYSNTTVFVKAKVNVRNNKSNIKTTSYYVHVCKY